jgi:hypothetical protein
MEKRRDQNCHRRRLDFIQLPLQADLGGSCEDDEEGNGRSLRTLGDVEEKLAKIREQGRARFAFGANTWYG